MAIKSVYTSFDGRLSRGGMFFYGIVIPFFIFFGIISFERESLAFFPAFLTSLEWVLLSPTLEPVLSLHVRAGSGNGWLVFEWHEMLKFLLFWPSIALSIKRFHDVGLSTRIYALLTLIMAAGFVLIAGLGFYLQVGQRIAFETIGLLLFIALPLIFLPSLAMLIIHFIVPGQAYENRYGADPRDS
jgi:uncharacterized membrane protein YhaH (DUF805 family)